MSIVGNLPRAPRFALQVPVCVRRIGAERWEPGHTVDISRSGLRVAAEIAVECGESIEMIVLLSAATDTVADVWLRGRVARIGRAGGVRQVAATIDDYRLLQADVSGAWMGQAITIEVS
jgi:hypothetical protein